MDRELNIVNMMPRKDFFWAMVKELRSHLIIIPVNIISIWVFCEAWKDSLYQNIIYCFAIALSLIVIYLGYKLYRAVSVYVRIKYDTDILLAEIKTELDVLN
ncbi:MAG: hypothetical protein RPR28_07785 [Cycloclasticus sp.]